VSRASTITAGALKVAVAGALALSLGGCAILGLLGGGGKKNAAQLYRFGASEGAALAPVSTSAVNVQLSNLRMDPAAEGDRLLGVTGTEAAYIANSRWVAPARDLFTHAAERAFDRAGVRLVRRDQPITPDLSLALEVPTFEARYENGAEAAPVVIVEVRAALVQGRQRDVLGETTYTVRQPATENRVGAIVTAYDQATRSALDQTAAWAAATARRAPPAPTR
jgi:cholesterol transport system auxiliary component